MTEIHAFEPDGTPSPGAQTALDNATEGLATEAHIAQAVDDATTGLASETYVNGAVDAIPNATPEKRGLMAAEDKAHLDLTPTRTEVEYEIHALDRNFGAIGPRYVTRPNVRVNNVIQSIGRTRAGLYFIVQRVSTSNDLEVSRCDAGGRVIDSSVLLNGGHGASVGLEEQADGVYLWIWWDGKSDGAKNALKRWKYVGGRTVPENDASAETMPDFGSSKPGFRWAGVNINQQLDLIGINNRTVDGDNIEVCRFSDYVAGKHTVLGTLPTLPLSEHGAFQGLVATEEYCYVLRGTGGLDAPHADRAHLDQFRWSTGEKVFTKELAYLTYLGRDGLGKSEPDGMCAWYDDAGRLSLLFAIETNTGGGNLHNIYSMAPADFQADTGTGAAMQLMFSPLNWVNVPLEDGFEYRGSGWELQVAKDPHGMVYLRGHMSNKGLTNLPSDAVRIATLAREYWPEVEVRWIGYTTGGASNPWGGWIRTGDGGIMIQPDSRHPDSGPAGHFSLIAQPWQARA